MLKKMTFLLTCAVFLSVNVMILLRQLKNTRVLISFIMLWNERRGLLFWKKKYGAELLRHTVGALRDRVKLGPHSKW